jgi:hypothetical protein
MHKGKRYVAVLTGVGGWTVEKELCRRGRRVSGLQTRKRIHPQILAYNDARRYPLPLVRRGRSSTSGNYTVFKSVQYGCNRPMKGRRGAACRGHCNCNGNCVFDRCL